MSLGWLGVKGQERMVTVKEAGTVEVEVEKPNGLWELEGTQVPPEGT